jgi:hypothetical protein
MIATGYTIAVSGLIIFRYTGGDPYSPGGHRLIGTVRVAYVSHPFQ